MVSYEWMLDFGASTPAPANIVNAPVTPRLTISAPSGQAYVDAMRAAGHIMAYAPLTAYSPTGDYGGVLEATGGDLWSQINPFSSFYQGAQEMTVVTLAAGFSFVQGFAAGLGSVFVSAAAQYVFTELTGSPTVGLVAGLAAGYFALDFAGEVHDYLYYEQWGMSREYKWLYDWSFYSGAVIGGLYGMYLQAPETLYELAQDVAPYVDEWTGSEQGTTMGYVDYAYDLASEFSDYVLAGGSTGIYYDYLYKYYASNFVFPWVIP